MMAAAIAGCVSSYSKYFAFRQLLKRCKSSFKFRRIATGCPLLLNRDYDTANLDEESRKDDARKADKNYYDVLYPGHIQTTAFQKALLAVGSAAMCLYNPARDDMICSLGETTGYYALKSIKRKMLSDPVGRQILEDQPLVNSKTVDIDYIGSLPDGTFGKEYWKFLSFNGFSPDARRPVNFIDDKELVYVMLRYRQSHDFVHTLLGMPPHMLGEVVVKWVEGIQTGLPMCVLGAFFGPLRLGPKHFGMYSKTFLPWALRVGLQAKFLMTIYYEKHWEDNIVEMRENFNVEPLPLKLKMRDKRQQKSNS